MKNSGIPLSAFSPKMQAQIAAQLNGNAPGPKITIAASYPPPLGAGPKRLRQSSKAPNKTELAFAAHVRACYPDAVIYEQQVTLVLANGLRYTPDLFFPGKGARPAFYEVKGFMRDDAAAKIKMAAQVHRWADFFLVTKQGRTCGGWDIQVILPLK